LLIINYNDTKNIHKLFTKNQGVISCISTKSVKKNKSALYEIFNIIEFKIQDNKGEQLQYLKDIKVNISPYNAISDYKKLSILHFIAEITTKVIDKHKQDEDLFNFIESAIHQFLETDQYINFHLWYSLQLLTICGFITSIEKTFRHDDHRIEQIIKQLEFLMVNEYKQLIAKQLDNQTRRFCLKEIITLAQLLLPELGKIKSVEILETLNN
jgi:DNA repair protein RecO